MCMRKGGSENRVCFEGGSCLSVRYCEQRMGADKLCVGNHGMWVINSMELSKFKHHGVKEVNDGVKEINDGVKVK